jgi:DNA-binding MurR/RpiR family transcriptional regulator
MSNSTIYYLVLIEGADMRKEDFNVVSTLESVYSNFTESEKKIADYFIHNKEKKDFSAKKIVKELYVSQASLTRFAKKSGFNGYREFVYYYKKSITDNYVTVDNLTEKVFNMYDELLKKAYSLIDDGQIARVCNSIMESKKVYVYGIGSSGVVAREFKIRFMRLGLNVEYIVDEHIMKMNGALLDEECLVIGITLSAKIGIIRESLMIAKGKKAKTIIITSNNDYKLRNFCDEILLVAVKENLEGGNNISPQFPILLVVDVLYAHFLNLDYARKTNIFQDTLSIIKQEEEENERKYEIQSKILSNKRKPN